MLSDKDKRATYDRFGEEGLKNNQGSGDPFDIFRSAFGGGSQQQRKGNNMIADIEVDLHQLYKGDSVSVSLPPACAGVRWRQRLNTTIYR